MSSPGNDTEEKSVAAAESQRTSTGFNDAGGSGHHQAAKRRLSSTAVIEISDTDSDDSDVCAVNSYQASADEVKRIRKDYTSSSSSSSDYSSDSESPWEDDSIIVQDKFETKAKRAELNPRANRMDDPQINPSIKLQEVIERLKSHWNENKDHLSKEVTLTCQPFKVCRVHNLLANPEIINNIVDDMNTLDWTRKKMDLYEFHQTTDLANLTWQRSIRGIYELLKTDLKNWISQVTGLELNSVSASCSLYGPGDHLLIHDDRMTDRRVAFILYLAPWHRPDPQHHIHNGDGDATNHMDETWCGWSERMGGALELFSRDASGAPLDVERRFYPANNMLAFFQVGTDSYHQVGEVLSMELPRLSINGWFHGPAPEVDPPVPQQIELHKPHAQVVVVAQWLSSTYMSTRVRAQVQAQMERASEVSLQDLLLPDCVAALTAALDGPDVQWERCSGRQQRHYMRVSPAWAEAAARAEEPHPVAGLLRLASSAAFVRVLADCTDLALSAYAGLELQRWAPGDYSLLAGREQYERARLEATLFLGPPARLSGGQRVYVAPEEAARAEALLSVPPRHNALALVYCDAGAAAFTKYLSRLSVQPPRPYYVLSCCYYE